MAALGLCCCAQAFFQSCPAGATLLLCAGFSLRWLLLLRSTGSRRTGFSNCSTRAQQSWHADPRTRGLRSCGTWAQQLRRTGSRAHPLQLWCVGLAALQHVGSSRTRDRTHVPCIGRRALNHCAAGEVLLHIFLNSFCKFHLLDFLFKYVDHLSEKPSKYLIF